MKVLVTGGGGFLGSAICSMLVSRGDNVQSISRKPYAKLNAMSVAQFQGDLQNHIFFFGAIGANGTRVLSAMTCVNGDHN